MHNGTPGGVIVRKWLWIAMAVALPGVAWAQSQPNEPDPAASRSSGGNSSGGTIGGSGSGNKSDTFDIGRAGGHEKERTGFGDYTKLPVQSEDNGQPTKRINGGTLRPGED